MAAMVERDVAYCPTLIALEQQAGLHPDIADSTAFGDEELKAWAAFEERVRANWSSEDARNRLASLEMRREWVRRFHAMGGRVLVGTDMQFGGPAMHREIAILHDIGLSAPDVIAAATGGAARAMRVGDRLGTIEAGKLADLVVVNGDPLVDLRALLDIDLVIRNGEVVAGALAAGLR
jgi:imidazolonepropionase-like amidohydrolase